MAKSLRAADLGYEWPECLPDGATWTRNADRRETLWHTPAVDERWVPRDSNGVLVTEDREWLGLTPPDFGDRPWQECILIKGQEPADLPPCPLGDGWIEWHGGECPVPPTTDVDVQLRNGDVTTDNFVGDSRARDWLWETDGGDGDIVRYRVHQPKFRPHTDAELMTMYSLSSALVRKDRQGGGRVDSWARINGAMHVGISGDPSKWSANGLWLYWEHRDGSPCGVEVSDG